MSDHPIESLMRTTMDSLKAMVDVNTVVGDPVETAEGTVIIPVSRVSFGFVTGGGDEVVMGDEGGGPGQGNQGAMQAQQADQGQSKGWGRQGQDSGTSDQIQGPENAGPSPALCRPMPFTGGTGAGVSVKPVGFLVVGDNKVRFMPVDSRALYDRLIEEVPGILDRIATAFEKRNDGADRESSGQRRGRRDTGGACPAPRPEE